MKVSLDKNGQPKITEKVWQEQVRQMALKTGWRYYHTFNAIRSPGGFPDCVLVHKKKRRLIFAELKTNDGKVSQDQEDWLNDLRAVRDFGGGQPKPEVYLWRPFDSDRVWETLKG